MSTLGKMLLVSGVIFPALSIVTGIASVWTSWRSNRHSSPVFIPLIGPILLSLWVFVEGHPLWTLLAVWGLDIGTLAFAAVLPRLLREYWNTSSFTRVLTLRGNSGIQNAIITLHSTGCYLLKKSWNRAEGEVGIVGLGEPGTFSADGDAFELTSHFGLKRKLVRTADSSYQVEEYWDGKPVSADYSLQGWLLKS